MSIYPAIDLIGQPDYATALARLTPEAVAGVDTLVVYDTDYDFLARVLHAAGYDDPPLQLQLLEWPATEPLDLAGLLRRLKIKRVMLFGQDAASLGVHFTVADYFPVTVSGVTYLLAPSVATIATAKAAGDNGPAGALWRAVKGHFLR